MYAITACGVQCLAAGCRGSGAEQQGVRPGRGMLHDAVVQQTHIKSYLVFSNLCCGYSCALTEIINACAKCTAVFTHLLHNGWAR
jgi:hypothetical protein